MKYIKLFEKHKHKPRFKEGDFVYAIDISNQLYLEEDTRYEIVDVFAAGVYQSETTYQLKEIPSGRYRENRFISEEEWKLKDDLKKYNI